MTAVAKWKRFTKLLFISKNSSKGFSLMEILIAITLLALIGGVVTTQVLDSLAEGKYETAKTQILGFDQALKNFKRHCNFFPTSEDGLQALISGPKSKECKRFNKEGYLDTDEIPYDPWDNDYVYESDGRKYDIISYGDDLEEGGDGWGADIRLSDVKKRK